jgi:hypothetical protein
MGRLTLNVLLSFAQFEREVIGERVRDKIAASKRKGIWVGGPVPLGYASINKKLVVVPEEAKTVGMIFRRYLELGSIGALVQDLDRRGIRTKRQEISNGRVRGGIRFGVGSLSHLLRNRFYAGEVVYRGKVHRGEHEPIVDLALFERVQAKLTDGRAERRLRLKACPAILAGRLFDDRGNRMSPTHTNKRGARYRYYVSQAILQKRPEEGGGVARVPAGDVEALVVEALRKRDDETSKDQSSKSMTDRDLIERYADRIIVRPQAIEIHVHDQNPTGKDPRAKRGRPSVIISVSWSIPAAAAKGILHSSSSAPSMSPESRDALLAAIAKARVWIETLVEGRVASLAEIAKCEGKVERYVRFLAPLAFLSPRVMSAILNGSAPAGLTVTGLAKSLPCSWAEQERQLGLPQE